MKVIKSTKVGAKDNLVILIQSEKELSNHNFSKEEIAYIKKCFKAESKLVNVNRLTNHVFVALNDATEVNFDTLEQYRRAGSKVTGEMNANKLKDFTLVSDRDAAFELAFIEGTVLANYQFLKYKSDKKENSLASISVKGNSSKKQLDEVVNIAAATNNARDLVNEPLSFLNAVQISKEIKKLGKEAGFKVEVFNKAKIVALKMGGLLAVNQGSIDPPTFSILEWKPAKPKNKKPIVLVGKGVVYDTGGLSLKPTPNSMDIMKCDMGGAAAVIGAMYAIAKNKLPYHVVTLVPATDNRPGGNAYAPGDVVTMHSGKTVEVLNTDAEGRMLLADGLSYADKYKPELIIDAATLTGAAARAIGYYGVVAMGNADEAVMNKMKASGNNTYERIVEFPFWDEYAEQLKSSVADITNLGGAEGGAITAGKFLENFTDHPYIHLDIAGPAWMGKPVNYITKGGSGVGVRLLYDFVKNYN